MFEDGDGVGSVLAHAGFWRPTTPDGGGGLVENEGEFVALGFPNIPRGGLESCGGRNSGGGGMGTGEVRPRRAPTGGSFVGDGVRVL